METHCHKSDQSLSHHTGHLGIQLCYISCCGECNHRHYLQLVRDTRVGVGGTCDIAEIVSSMNEGNEWSTTLRVYLLLPQVQVVVIFRNFILPYIFALGELVEREHPRVALKVLLVRYR